MEACYKASPALEQFVHNRAPKFHPDPNGPARFRDLMDWWKHKGMHGQSMPVFDGGCQDSIWSSDEMICAYRAFHDHRHCMLHKNFQEPGEWRVALDHIKEARSAGLGDEDCRALLCWHWGQVKYYWTHKDYVHNTGRFVAACMEKGIKTVLDSGEKF